MKKSTKHNPKIPRGPIGCIVPTFDMFWDVIKDAPLKHKLGVLQGMLTGLVLAHPNLRLSEAQQASYEDDYFKLVRAIEKKCGKLHQKNEMKRKKKK